MRNQGRKAEKLVLKKIKAHPQPNSGSIPGMPNDGVKGKYLIEVKSTTKGSMSIKRSWLEDVNDNALMRGKTAALILIFGDDGTPLVVGHAQSRFFQPSAEWVAMPLIDFERITKGWKT